MANVLDLFAVFVNRYQPLGDVQAAPDARSLLSGAILPEPVNTPSQRL